MKDPNKCARSLGELSNLDVDITTVQESYFICAADGWVLENDFVVLSAFSGRCSAGVSLLVGRSLDADVNLVFADDGD